MITVAIAEDYELIRKGFVKLIRDMNMKVVVDVANGKQLIEQLATKEADVVLMDITMPEMNGIETTTWLSKHMPHVRVLALSVSDDDLSVIRMMKAGARGYLIKSVKPADLHRAIVDVYQKGFHFSDLLNNKLITNLVGHPVVDQPVELKDREIEFLRYLCTEMTYREIGECMHASTRTIENWVKSLGEKLQVKTRTSLVLYAIKNNIVKI